MVLFVVKVKSKYKLLFNTSLIVKTILVTYTKENVAIRRSLNMIVFAATLTAKSGKEQSLQDALVEMVSKVQEEEGTLIYTLLRSKEDPKQFTVYEKYKNQAALDHHDTTTHMNKFRAKLDSLLGDAIKIDHFEEIASISR
jgi:quinol monooxygenase YgiN